MTPKEKADSLYATYHNMIQEYGGELGQEILVSVLAKKAALIEVDEILELLNFELGHDNTARHLSKYYEQVKQEIEKL